MAELNIGALTGSTSYTGSIGATNIYDLYKFNITSPGSFKFAIDNLSGNADIFLLNKAGATLYSSTNAGNAAETINADSLVAGEYSVKVLPITGDIKYTLNLAPTKTQTTSAADTLTGAKSDSSLPSNSVATLEKTTANKDVITGDAVGDKTVTAEAKTATTEKPVTSTSETTAKSEPEKTVTPTASAVTTSAKTATTEKPVSNTSETTAKSEAEKTVTPTASAVATSETTEKAVSSSSETTIKSEAEKTVPETATATATTTEKPVTSNSAIAKAPTTSETTEKPVTTSVETTIKTEPEKTAIAGETVASKDPKTSETVAAVPETSKPAEKPNTATTNGEDKKTENTNTAVPTAETTKKIDPPTNKELTAANPFTSGVFVVDSTGKASIDYILDGGLYRGQLAIISLTGMEKFVPGSPEFFKEAAARAMSNSAKGHIVINDLSEGARFAGNLPEGNFNEGAYLGVKTFSMTPGDEFGIMMVPNDTVKFVYDYPSFGGDKRPLFSMVTANPNEGFHLGQIADVTGEGNTFTMEDLRFDLGTDKDYNDIVFQIRGAKGKATLMDSVVNPDKDWRKTDLGKAVIAYAKPYITPEPETKPNLKGEISDAIDELEKEISTPSTSEKETPKTPATAAATDKKTTDGTKVSPTEKVEKKPANPTVKAEEKVKDTANNSGDATKVETADKVDTKPTDATTTSTAGKDTMVDSTEKSPVEKTPVPPAAIEVEDKVTEVPAAETLPAKSTADKEVTTTEKVETNPEVLPAETPAKEESKPAVVTEVKDKVNETPAAETLPDKSTVKTEVAATTPTQKVETKLEFLPAKTPTKQETMPVVDRNAGAESQKKETVTETESAGVDDATPKESLPVSGNVEKSTDDNSTAAVNETVKEEVSQNNNVVNDDWFARLESIKQRLIDLSGADAVEENAIDRTSIARLETLTQKLQEQARSNPISDNTAALISRLEDMVVKVAPQPVAPVQPVQFEFPQADRPLVGFITETGLTVNNPAEDKSPIVAAEKPANSTNNPSPSATADNNSKNPIVAAVPTNQSNGTSVNGVNNNPSQPVDRAEDSSSQWVESLIKFVDAAKESKQPHAVVNININLTKTQPDGTVIPRKELTAAERSAIAYAYQNNVIIVVPAGDNPGTMSALGLLSKEVDNVITVGAAQRFNDSVALSNAFKLADYSGSGNTLDVLAKGSSDNTSSTKVAAVEVTNAIAQVLAANPKLNYTQAIDIIKRTATDLDRPNWDAQTGSGLLNVAAAVQLAKATTPELYTLKPGRRTITDVFISQHPSAKQLPGDPTHPTVKVPGIPQTNVDRGSNNLANATKLIPSATEDVIDQVSSVDPSDIYRVDSRYLNGAKFSVLSGDLSVSYLTTSGQLLGTQSFSKGSHKLQLPANAPAEVIVKIDQRNATPATYVLSGFESTATEPFNIDLEYETPLSASQQAIMQAAAKSVAGLIGKGLPSAVVDGKIIDDINIKISTANIDGASGTQARTKIDFMRYGSMLPAQSLVQFDAADIAELERSGKLFSVVQHEFLHALGFGNLWEAKGLVDYAGTPLAQYNGGKAVDAFKDLGGLTDAISLETEGKGSAGFHWNESLFQDEVMTADLNFSGKAGNAPISPVTIASLADLGYEVNLNAATPDFGLFGGGRFNSEDLTPEQIEAFRQLAEISFEEPGAEYIAPIMPAIDPDKVAPEIWAHAERFWKNGEYYDWVRYQVKKDEFLTHISLRTMGSVHPDYYYWIANHNGIPNPDWIVTGDWIEIPVHRPNYEQEQEQKLKEREAELKKKQEEEAKKQKELEEKLKQEEEQKKLKELEEKLKQEAEAKQKELEEQAKKLEEDLRKKRQQEELEKEQARLREIERQKGLGGQDWYLAKQLPEFGPTDPFETKLTGETVGNLVPDDYYRFTLSRKGRIDARLMNLLADADLVLYDARNRPISYSMREGITDEQILADLIPGTYMLRVNSPKGVTTDYDLIVKFKHLLSRTEQGPPPGWRVGGGNGNGGGGGATGSLFSDPRIRRIYDTALANFAGPERAKANAKIAELEREKRSYEQQMQDLLNQMNAEQRQKVHQALDNARNEANAWVNNIANPIKNTVDSLADGIINKANSFANDLENQVNKIPDWLAKDLKDEAKRFIRQGRDAVTSAVNSGRSWLKGKLAEIQNGVNSAIQQFFDTIKNAYRTGAEINQIIANAAQTFRNNVDRAVQGANDLIGQFKGQVLSAARWTQNLGIHFNKFGQNINFDVYNNIIQPAVNSVADGFQWAIGGIGNSLKGIVDWIEPHTQKTVADILNAILGDKTGHLWNQINGVDSKISATRTGVEKAISEKGKELQNGLNDLLVSVANVGHEIVDSVRSGLQATNLALSYVASRTQEDISSLFNNAEKILKGASSTFANLISEKTIDFAKKINPLQWGIEDIAASGLENIVFGNQSYVLEFKDNWVRQHSNLLRTAAAKYNLSSLIMAGVAWNEAGGQPDYLSDDLTFWLRMVDFVAKPSNLPDNFAGNLLKKVLTEFPVIKRVPGSTPEQTSFGQIQMQIRIAAQELGYSPDSLTKEQKIQIAFLLKKTEINIELAARHLATLRKIDFVGNNSPAMSDDEIKIVATRYNANNRSDGSVRTLEQIREVINNGNTYGTQIISMRDHLQSLLA